MWPSIEQQASKWNFKTKYSPKGQMQISNRTLATAHHSLLLLLLLLLEILGEAVNNNPNINKPYNRNPRADKA